MTRYEEIKAFVNAMIKEKGKNCTMTSSEIIDKMRKMYPKRKSDAQPPDFCYNKINKGFFYKGFSCISMTRHKLFEWDNESKKYIFRGENFRYRGVVFGKYGGKQNVEIGKIDNNGELILKTFYKKQINN